SAYVVVVLASVFAGAFWLSRYCAASGLSPICGLAFLVVPAVAVSLDRMTVDVALAALCVAFALYGVAAPSSKIPAVLLLAPLARETGLVLIAAFALKRLTERRWKEALFASATALPWLAWTAYLRIVLWGDATPWVTLVPFAALAARLTHPVQY